MIERSVLAAIKLLTLKAEVGERDLQKLIRDYCQQKQQGSLSLQAQIVEGVLNHWYREIEIKDIENILATLDEQSDYQHRDKERLEDLAGYLEILKHGPDELRFEALEQIEKVLLRVHSPSAIAWDFGGVLMDGHNKFFIQLYAHSKGIELPKEQLLELWQTIFKSQPIPHTNYDALKIGQATPEQFARHAIGNFNTALAKTDNELIEVTQTEIRNFLTLYYSHYDSKQENRQVLDRIRKLGIRQYGLTNNFMAKIKYFLERKEFDYLQGLIAIVSEKFGASKPASRIYLSFKQHVFLDRFAKEVLEIDLPDWALEQLWQGIFAEISAKNSAAYERQQISCEPVSEEAIAQYNRVIEPLGYDPVDVDTYAKKWLKFWAENYNRLARQTIFVDDKTRNLDRAFEYEEILGVHYDANQGEEIAAQPVIEELLAQEQLKQVVRTLRELTATQNSLGKKARQTLERLMPLRIRHEKLIWQEQENVDRAIIKTLSDKQIYALLQKHYDLLYETHFKLGHLVSRQYELIYRLAILPEYTYDEARQIVLQLFETSELFLDQNRDLYPWQNAEVPEELTEDLSDLQTNESLLKKKLLPEIKRKIINFIKVLDVAEQTDSQELLERLSAVEDLETIEQLTDQLLDRIAANNFNQIEQNMKSSGDRRFEEKSSSHPPAEWYRQFKRDAKQIIMNFLPLKKLVANWEREIHQLESSYFEQYDRWKTLKNRLRDTLYQDALLDKVRERFTIESLYQLMRGLLLKVFDLPRWKDPTKPTMILVSGASGSGKSTLSTHIARIFGIQKVFSTDEAGRANAKALLDFLFEEDAKTAFSGLYQSSFEGSLESYYYQAVLTTIGVEGLAKRLHKQNTSAMIEGVGLMPGLLSEPTFELLNIDWLIMQVESQQHWQNFEHRAKGAVKRSAKRYQDNFEMIRCLHDRIITMGLKQGLTIVENRGPIQQAIAIATERIKGPVTNQFIKIYDPIREQTNELLATQRQHLPVKVRFDAKRAALNLGIEEKTITKLIHRFGFEEVPQSPHQWIRQSLSSST
ncbi:hypothetical protein [Myxosarcina sp. GI1]|uniref:hypothetical protein n=1 Tax=Myxosarcina sp. GI1 TaxID=1541065 RepID=UPI00055FDBBE|nr:hypothetical protein [Myxosarcina sp. GI1]